jgi:hypothetical protein
MAEELEYVLSHGCIMDSRMVNLIKEIDKEKLSTLLDRYFRLIPQFILQEFRKYGARYSKNCLRFHLITMPIEILETLMPEEWSLITSYDIHQQILLSAEIPSGITQYRQGHYLPWMKIVSRNIDCSKIDWTKCSSDSLNNFYDIFRYDELKFLRENFGFTNVEFSVGYLLNFLFSDSHIYPNVIEFFRTTLECLHFFNVDNFKMSMTQYFITPFRISLRKIIVLACIKLRQTVTYPTLDVSKLSILFIHKTLYEDTIYILLSQTVTHKEQHALFLHIIYIMMDMLGFHDDVIYFKPVIRKYMGIKASSSLRNLCYQLLFFKLRPKSSANSTTSKFSEYTSFLERVNFVLGPPS